MLEKLFWSWFSPWTLSHFGVCQETKYWITFLKCWNKLTEFNPETVDSYYFQKIALEKWPTSSHTALVVVVWVSRGKLHDEQRGERRAVPNSWQIYSDSPSIAFQKYVPGASLSWWIVFARSLSSLTPQRLICLSLCPYVCVYGSLRAYDAFVSDLSKTQTS